jgi:hypothetical protein
VTKQGFKTEKQSQQEKEHKNHILFEPIDLDTHAPLSTLYQIGKKNNSGIVAIVFIPHSIF